MNIVSIMNPKGGAGKTTTTVSLASFAMQNHKVAIVDMDPQASIKTWMGEDSPIQTFSAKRLSHVTALPSNPKANLFDFIFVDSPASMNAEHAQAVIGISDFIVVPCKASLIDLEPTMKFVDEMLIPNQKAFKVLLTQVIPGSTYVDSIRARLEQQRIPMFQQVIRQYQAYMQASELNTSIFSMGHEASGARNDYGWVGSELVEEVNHLNTATSPVSIWNEA